MATIKMNKDTITTAATNVENKVTVYKDATVAAIAQFSQLQTALTGAAYESLVTQINSSLESQKTLVAECIVLTENVKTFAESISNAEDAVTFA